MDEILNQLLDRFEAGLQDRYLKIQQKILIDNNAYPLELNKSQCAMLLIGTTDTKTFDERFNRHKDFPRIEGRRDKFPRDEVIDWYHKNWKRTGQEDKF